MRVATEKEKIVLKVILELALRQFRIFISDVLGSLALELMQA